MSSAAREGARRLTTYLAGHATVAEIMQRAALNDDGSPLFAGLGSAEASLAAAKRATWQPISWAVDGSSWLDCRLLSPHFDWIIVDSSPVNLVTDGVNLAAACDAVLMVARGGVTKFEACVQRALAELKSSKILGVVLNAVDTPPSSDGCTAATIGLRSAPKIPNRSNHAMIRLLNVYYPTRTVMLLLCEAVIVASCFFAAAFLVLGPDVWLALNYEYGYLKIAALTFISINFSYYFDLFEPQLVSAREAIYFRILLVLAFDCFVVSADLYFFPESAIGPGHVYGLGLALLTPVLILWRRAYDWIVSWPFFRERVYVLAFR